MAVIHFIGANGFPARCYQHIFDALKTPNIHFIDVVAQQTDSKNFGWDSIADEIIDNIERLGCAPVIGIGHSMGASTTLLAAQKRPELFSQLILIEPILFKPIIRGLIFMRGLKDRKNKGNPLAKQARERKQLFESRSQARDYFNNKPLFKNFAPQSIDHYIKYGLVEAPQSRDKKTIFTLAFPRQTEADIFASAPLLIRKPKLDIPVYLAFGASSDLLSYMHIGLWQKLLSRDNIYFRPGGHLFPFEEPQQSAVLIQAIIDNDLVHLNQSKQLSQELMPSTSALKNSNTITIKQTLASTPELITQYFLDAEKRRLWINGLKSFSYQNKTSNWEGSTFTQRITTPGQGQLSTGTISKYLNNNCIVFSIKNSLLEIEHTVHLHKLNEKNCSIEQEVIFKIVGPIKLLTPLIHTTVSLTLRQQLLENLMNLKQLLAQQ